MVEGLCNGDVFESISCGGFGDVWTFGAEFLSSFIWPEPSAGRVFPRHFLVMPIPMSQC